MVNLLRETGNLPVYYPDDGEVYLRAANMPDGSMFIGFFNISLDPIEEITLVCERAVKSVKQLMPNGSYRSVDFAFNDGKLFVLCGVAQTKLTQRFGIKVKMVLL